MTNPSLSLNLDRFPRRRYTEGPTLLHKLEHLSELLGGPEIYIKRDDLLGLTAGGNKTRKLEFLVADALQQGADTLITCGAVQSNHCRLTLAAANVEGMKCQLVLEERVPGTYDPKASGNNFLYRLLGVEEISVVRDGADPVVEMERLAGVLAEKGRQAYVIPGGGSTPVGATGYVACGLEILSQLQAQDLEIDHVVLASGSGGTHSGLLTALEGLQSGIPVTGVNVRRSKAEQEEVVHGLVQRVAERVGLGQEIPRTAVRCVDDYLGAGYSLVTDEMVEAVQLLARSEAILLDPVYTGKAMAGLIGMIRRGDFRLDAKVLFLHTGGSPALYAYRDAVLTD